MKTENQMRANYIFILALLLFSLMAIQVVSAGATPNSTLSWTGSTSSTITWMITYTGVIRPSGATLDGVEIQGFDLAHAINYTAQDLEPNSTHELCIYKDLINCAKGQTLLDPNAEEAGSVMDFFNTWGYLVLILICCFVGMKPRLGIFLLIASAISLYALYLLISGGIMTGGDLLSNVLYLIYLIFFIIPLWLCFGVKKGVFR